MSADNDRDRSYKTIDADSTDNTTQAKTVGRDLCQEIARQETNRDNNNNTRSHKSNQWLTDSPHRTDTRYQLYTANHAWRGMSHE